MLHERFLVLAHSFRSISSSGTSRAVSLALLCKASTPQPIPTLELQQQYARSDTPPLKFTLDDVIHAIRSSVHFSREPEGDTLEETEALLPQLSSPLPVTKRAYPYIVPACAINIVRAILSLQSRRNTTQCSPRPHLMSWFANHRHGTYPDVEG